MIKGIDVSKYQGDIDWAKVKASGIQFAILKAIDKSNRKEESFDRNYAECLKNNIPIGAYNYSYATTTKKAEEDAIALLSVIADKKIKMKVWLDVEDNALKVLGGHLIQIIKAYQSIIESAGFEFGVYTGLSFYNSFIKPYDTLKCDWWIARYPSSESMMIGQNPNEAKKPDIGHPLFAWQYTSKGIIDGVPAKVDVNILYDEKVIQNESGLTGNGLAQYAISKLGTPYFYGMKMETLTNTKADTMHRLYPDVVNDAYLKKAKEKGLIGRVCVDCSGLIGAYRHKQIGSAKLYSTASKRLPMDKLDDFAIGVVLWKKGHCGVYIGNGYCVEAKGINYGTIKSKVLSTNWTCGLTFDDISYSYDKKIVAEGKKQNPYTMPTRTLKKTHKGEDVKWLQFELNEAGFSLVIDGDFGSKTLQAVKEFQMSCKIEVDGIVGKVTRSKLIEL